MTLKKLVNNLQANISEMMRFFFLNIDTERKSDVDDCMHVEVLGIIMWFEDYGNDYDSFLI